AAKTGETAEVSKYIFKRISLAAIRISLISIRIPLSSASIAALTVPFCLFLHHLLISLLNLFEFFFIRLWIVQIGIRMIFPAQFLICFFYLFFRSIPRYSENFIWISHVFLPFSLLVCF